MVFSCRVANKDYSYIFVVQKDTVYGKSFEVEKFHSFRGSIGNHETFPVFGPGLRAIVKSSQLVRPKFTLSTS